MIFSIMDFKGGFSLEKIIRIAVLLICLRLERNLFGEDQLQWITKSGQTIDCVISGRCNVYLLRKNDKILLVDTSTIANLANLNTALCNLSIDHIDYLLLTHTHFDHVENANFICTKFGAKIIVSSLESENLFKGYSSLPKGTNIFTRVLSNIGNVFPSKFSFEPVKPDLLISQVFDLSEIGFNAKIIPTPGHSIGSLSLFVDNEIAIVGDAAVGVIKNAAYPPFADDSLSLVQSWKILIDSNCQFFLPSHGKIIEKNIIVKEYEKFCLKTAST